MTKPLDKINWEFWVPAFFLGMVLIWYLILPSWWNIHAHWNASRWSEVDGRVTVARTYKTRTQERLVTRWAYEYEYIVDETVYKNDRYSFRYASGDKRMGVETHQRNQAVTVFYDPQSPSRSVIDRSLSPWWNYLVLSSVVFLPLAIWVHWNRVLAKPSRPVDARP